MKQKWDMIDFAVTGATWDSKWCTGGERREEYKIYKDNQLLQEIDSNGKVYDVDWQTFINL